MDQDSQNVHSMKLSLLDPPLKRPFLSNVDRFPPIKKASKIPGPGFYDPSESINESFNSKGYGNSFVSKSQRFPSQTRNTGPGPGAYYHSVIRSDSRIKRTKSPSFRKKKSRTHFKRVFEIPGPGGYNVKTKKNIPCAKYVFESGVDRLAGNGKWETPSPVHYLIKREFEELRDRKGTVKNSPFFLKPLNELKTERNIIEEIKNFKDPKTSQNQLAKPQNLGFKVKSFLKKIPHKTNLALIKTESSERKRAPGPGSYFNIDVENIKAAVTGAVFKSETKRGGKFVEKTDNLGPGSYQNFKPSKKQNFHYNMKQSWI